MKDIAFLILPFLALTACGGGSTGASQGQLLQSNNPVNPIEEAFLQEGADFETLKLAQAIPNAANTSWSAIPTSDSANFEGRMFVYAGGVVYASMFAKANVSLTADYANGTISAAHAPFLGSSYGRPTQFDGTIDITQGRIGSVQPNDVSFQLNGTLRTPDEFWSVNGPVTGKLRATPINSIYVGAIDQNGLIRDFEGQEINSTRVEIEAYRID